MHRRVLAISGALLLVVAQSAGASAAALPPDFVVEVRSISYSPSEISVPRGTSVRWENVTRPDRTHDVVSSIPELFGSGRYGTGEAFSYRFLAGGTFTYICSIHDVMIGAVHVPMAGRVLEGPDGSVMRVRLARRRLPSDSPFRFVVFRRDPGATDFVRWRMTRKSYLEFLPTAPGTYEFVMRVQNIVDGHETGPGGESPVLRVEWPG